MKATRYIKKGVTNNVPIEKVVKAFANEKRIAILQLLAKQPDLSVDNISSSLEYGYKLVSSHTNKLMISGLIRKKYLGHSVVHTLTKRGKQVLRFVRTLD